MTFIYFIYGIILSFLGGLANPLFRKGINELSFNKFMVLYSTSNVLLAIPFYKFVLHKNLNLSNLIYVPGYVLIYLLVYLLFRIISNQTQSKLVGDNKIDINIVTIVLAQTCFLTVLINAITTKTFNIMVFTGLIISAVGVLIVTVDFRKLTFCFTLSNSILLILAFITCGTKPNMGHELLKYFSPETLCVFEYINYFIVYTVVYFKEIRTFKIKNTSLKGILYVFILSIISFCSSLVQYVTFNDVIISAITSVTAPIFTAVFAYFITKTKISSKTTFGIFIITIGVIISKVFYH